MTGNRSDSAGVIVTSRIVPQSGTPIAVDWRPTVSDGLYKIENVAIDSVSMELAQRSEIAAIIGRNGGQFGPLLATMRVLSQGSSISKRTQPRSYDQEFPGRAAGRGLNSHPHGSLHDDGSDPGHSPSSAALANQFEISCARRRLCPRLT